MVLLWASFRANVCLLDLKSHPARQVSAVVMMDSGSCGFHAAFWRELSCDASIESVVYDIID